ncbi:uncharacterized protein C6orf203-like [Argonauta hians]
MAYSVFPARLWSLGRDLVRLQHLYTSLINGQTQRSISTSLLRPLTSVLTDTTGQGQGDRVGRNVSSSLSDIPRVVCHVPARAESRTDHLLTANSTLFLQRRYKKTYPKRRRKQTADSSHDDDDDDSDGDEEEEEKEYEEDYSLPLNYKQVKVQAKSTRVDQMLSSGLNISRNQIDQYFYSGRLRLNDEKLLKKSKVMNEGDFADVVTANNPDGGDGDIRVKRIKLLEVLDSRTSTDKQIIILRVWRTAFLPETPEHLS